MKNSRRRAREFALQALYQWLVNECSAEVLLAQLKEQKDFARADQVLAETLLRGVTGDAHALHERIAPYLDRPMKELSPVEHALLLLAACELRDHPETPYKVVINEAVELAKSFGGTDGHKYVNGVLDKLAAELRPAEVERNLTQRREGAKEAQHK
ncbi:MAG: transcription antitermination factor NusB [Betaproteobacteria bacterium]